MTLGVVSVQPVPNQATAPAVLGTNTPVVNLAQNGPFPLPPFPVVDVDCFMVGEVLPSLPAGSSVRGSPRTTSSPDYLYRYSALFTGTAPATLLVRSSPDLATWTTEFEADTTLVGSVYKAKFEDIAVQAYYQTVVTNGGSAQGACKLLDGHTNLVAA
jgi:hypothetical protein